MIIEIKDVNHDRLATFLAFIFDELKDVSEVTFESAIYHAMKRVGDDRDVFINDCDVYIKESK